MARQRAEVTEVINRNALVSIALLQGYVAFLPVYDPGIDLILYSETTGDLKKVQLKGRWTINKKYVGRDIHVAFPDRGIWYVAPHDEVLLEFSRAQFKLDGVSWTRDGEYSYAPLSKKMLALLEPYRFGSPKNAQDAAEEAVSAVNP